MYRNPTATTSIFKEVKRNFPDVDLAKALAAGTATDAVAGEEDASAADLGEAAKDTGGAGSMPAEDAIKAAIDMMKKMPGIDDKNVRRVVNAIDCVADLAGMSQEQLTPLIGPVNAKKLYTFLRSPFT